MSVSEAARYVKDTTKQVMPVTAEVPDAADSLNIEFERVKLTLEAAIVRDEGRVAEEAEGRELPERPLLEQTTLECAKENPSDLGTKVPESEARSDRVSRLGNCSRDQSICCVVDDTSINGIVLATLAN